jgi:hypothetical protein
MPTKITTIDQLLESNRFKKATNNKKYSESEIKLLNELFNFIQTNDNLMHSGSYSIFTALASGDLSNLIDRFKFIKQNTAARTEKTYIARYGETEGSIRWGKYKDKQKVKNLFETKQQKYGWTKEQFDNFNKSRAVTLEKCIERHGVEIGTKKWNSYIEAQRYTNGLDYYKKKYGDECGYAKWLEYNKEKGKSTKLEWIMEKYQVDETSALEILSNRMPKSHSSVAELRFIDSLELSLGETLQYTAKTKQFCIWNVYTNSPKFYDIADSTRRKIIEFHGDYWHCNPKKYDANFIQKHSGNTAKEIWEHDFLKIKAATDRGFEVKIVWWSEYEENPDKIIEETKQWLQSN